MAHSGQPMAKGRPAPLQDLQEGREELVVPDPLPAPAGEKA